MARPEGYLFGLAALCGISHRFRSSYPLHRAVFPDITHPSATRQRSKLLPVTVRLLHVLGLPPAFNHRRDQTRLQFKKLMLKIKLHELRVHS